jgi:hypothetical protein
MGLSGLSLNRFLLAGNRGLSPILPTDRMKSTLKQRLRLCIPSVEALGPPPLFILGLIGGLYCEYNPD